MKNLFEKILLQINLKNISYFNNNSILICFAGIPCSGKTRLAKKIEKKYKGIRINSDQIRKILSRFIKENEKREKIVREFLIKFLKDFPFKNKFVILDSGIERKFNEIKEVAFLAGWKIFIIKIITPKKEILKRIRKKDPVRFKEHPEDIKRWFKEYKEFNKRHKSDFIFKKDSDLTRLYSKLDSFIRQ